MICDRESSISKARIKKAKFSDLISATAAQYLEEKIWKNTRSWPSQKMCKKYALLNKTQDERIEQLSGPFTESWSDHWSKLTSTQIILFNWCSNGEVLSMLLSASLTRDPHADIDCALSVVVGEKKITSIWKHLDENLYGIFNHFFSYFVM